MRNPMLRVVLGIVVVALDKAFIEVLWLMLTLRHLLGKENRRLEAGVNMVLGHLHHRLAHL